MLIGMVGRVGNDSVCKYEFYVNGYFYIECSVLYGNIYIVYFIVCSVSAVKYKFG
jgi:hypothetical protein